MWTDSHCHLQDEDDPAAGFAEALAAGVDRVVLIGTGEASSARASEWAMQLSQSTGGEAYATVGQHPHDASSGTAAISALAKDYESAGRLRGAPGSVVAIGECGLDYHYEHSPRETQLEAFAAQIELSKRLGLALVVHTREAWDDTFGLLSELGTPERVVIHCFTGGASEARRSLDLGASLSFSGIVTFKNADDVRAAAALCPADRLLVETDAPYLAPVPHRGRPNAPALVAVVGEALAALRGEQSDELAERTSANAAALFGLS